MRRGPVASALVGLAIILFFWEGAAAIVRSVAPGFPPWAALAIGGGLVWWLLGRVKL